MSHQLSHSNLNAYPGVCWHSFPVWTGFPKLILCTILYPLILLWPSQPSRQAEYWSLAFEPLRLVLRTMVGINTYLSLEKGQCKFCSCTLLPFSLGLPPAFEVAGADDKLSFCKEGWDRALPTSCIPVSPHHRVCSFRGQAAPSPGEWPSATFSSRLHEDQDPQSPVCCPRELVWQAQTDSSAYNQHAPDEKQK